jgi:hypothetical protein
MGYQLQPSAKAISLPPPSARVKGDFDPTKDVRSPDPFQIKQPRLRKARRPSSLSRSRQIDSERGAADVPEPSWAKPAYLVSRMSRARISTR